MAIRVYDVDGREQNLAWAIEKYNVIVAEAAKHKDHWEVVELHEVIGPSSMTVRLVGDMIFGIPVAFYWPDAPEASHPSEPKPVKNVQATNQEGHTGFGMGPGAYYRADQGEHGPHAVWISEYPERVSDLVDGLGMLGGTNHAHLEPTFEFVEAEEGPEPDQEGIYSFKLEGTLTLLKESKADNK